MLLHTFWFGAALVLCIALIWVWGSRRGIARQLRAREEQAAAAQQELAERTRQLTELKERIVHDLRSPIQTIMGYAELLAAESTGPLNPKQRRFLDNLHDGVQKLTGLIDGSQATSRHRELERQQR